VAPATEQDLEPINEIYNHYVVPTAITFDLEPMTMYWRREWFGQFAEEGRHRLLVARESGSVIGYACSHAHRARPAYDPSVETSTYLDPTRTGRGVGGALYGTLLEILEREDVHRAYAGIALPNPASVRLHERSASAGSASSASRGGSSTAIGTLPGTSGASPERRSSPAHGIGSDPTRSAWHVEETAESSVHIVEPDDFVRLRDQVMDRSLSITRSDSVTWRARRSRLPD
jgi:phosphinothricin acetyltransferase